MRISKGCFNCIARKVKCDETKPECLRCTKYGRWCPGYRNHDQLMFRHTLISPDDPAIASSSHGQRVKAQSPEDGHHGFVERHTNINHALDHRIEDEAYGAFVDLERWGPTFQDEAVARFFSSWVLPLWAEHNYGGWLYFLPDFYASKSANSCLVMTTNALSVAHLGNIRSDVHLINQGCALYGKALIAVRQALAPAMLRANNDEILVSIFFLAMYELINKKEKQSQPWYFHIMGASTLLKNTVPNIDFSTDIGKHMLRLIHTQVVILSLSHGVELSRTLSAMTPRNLDQNDPSTHLRAIGVEVIAIAERVEHLVDNIDRTFPDKAKDMINEFITIDTKLTKWLEQLPEDWGYEVIPPVSSEVFPAETRTFQNYWAAANRDSQSCNRIMLHWTFINLLQNLIQHGNTSSDYKDLLSKSVAIIRESANDICAAVPYLLRETYHKTVDYELDGTCIGAYSVLWPLQLITRSPYVPEEQRMWAKNLLVEKIGKRLGIHAALAHPTDGNTWLSQQVGPNKT